VIAIGAVRAQAQAKSASATALGNGLQSRKSLIEVRIEAVRGALSSFAPKETMSPGA
jgi:hypothetical protein